MNNTRYVDTTGLSRKTYRPRGSGGDGAGRANPLIREFSTQPEEYVQIPATGNPALQQFECAGEIRRLGYLTAKTGFIREAGRCVVMLAQIASARWCWCCSTRSASSRASAMPSGENLDGNRRSARDSEAASGRKEPKPARTKPQSGQQEEAALGTCPHCRSALAFRCAAAARRIQQFLRHFLGGNARLAASQHACDLGLTGLAVEDRDARGRAVAVVARSTVQ